MIKLYETDSVVEAYMVLNMIQQAGLVGRVDGEHLQSGIGELQAFGLVRVMVEETDYQQAKQLLDEWQNTQIKDTSQSHYDSRKSTWGSAVVGFLFGVGLMLVFFNTPMQDGAVDHDGDGNLDQKWTYFGDGSSKLQTDRNSDGKMDDVYHYDQQGLLVIIAP